MKKWFVVEYDHFGDAGPIDAKWLMRAIMQYGRGHISPQHVNVHETTSNGIGPPAPGGPSRRSTSS